MKKLKKISLGALAIAMGLGSTTLTGCNCGNPDELQVMNLSINPGVEFIVDENDKVLSVTANNEDGAFLLDKYTEFTGMSAENAALKFLELSEEYGFVVSGTVNGESITISVSGDGAKSLYNDVKEKISTKVSELGLTIGDMVKITQDELESIVSQCYQELSATEIDGLSSEKLLDLIKNSRIETAGIHTEHERLAYYKERAQKLIETKINTIKEYIESNQDSLTNLVLTPLVSAMDIAYQTIETAYSTIDSQLESIYESIESQMNTYVDQKEEYLAAVEDYRDALEANADADTTNDFTTQEIEALKEELIDLKSEAKTLYNELDSTRKDFAEDLIEKIQTTIHSQITLLNNKIDEILEKINITTETMNTQIQAAIDDLKDMYSNYSTNPWTQE